MFDFKVIMDSIHALPLLADIIKIMKRDGKPLISMKHLVVKSDFVLRDIMDYKFQSLYEEFQTKRVYLQENEVFACLKQIYRDHIVNNYYNNWNETPVSLVRDSEMFEKTVTSEDLTDLSNKYDSKITAGIIKNLTSVGKVVDPKHFCRVTYYSNGCGDGEGVAEVIEFRQLWLVLLWIENLSIEPVEIDGYSGKMYYPNVGLEFRELLFDEGENYVKGIPFKVLQPGESILIPEFILLSPVESYLNEDESEIKCDEFGEFGFAYNFTTIQTGEQFYLTGPSLSVKEIKVGKEVEVVHKFNITNLLTVSERFYTGSCPYAIGYKDNQYYYIRDILTRDYEIINIREYQYIIISEIEDEITFLEKVVIGDKSIQETVVMDVFLLKGNSIIINNLKSNANLYITGKYFAMSHGLNNKYSIIFKYQNLKKFLKHLPTLAACIPAAPHHSFQFVGASFMA